MSRRRIALIIVLVFASVAAFRSTFSRDVPGDFLRYHRAGRLVATGKADKLYDKQYLRGQHVYAEERAEELRTEGEDADDLHEKNFKYLPATAVLIAPFGALHPRSGSVLWTFWNGLLIATMFVACWRAAAGGLKWTWALIPLLVLLRVANDNLQLGQLNPTAIASATLAVLLLSRGWDKSAGLLAAFGAVVKFMPVFLIIWFAWKRRWKALGATVAGIAAIGWGLPALVLGPSRATSLTVQYFEIRTHHYASAASTDLPGHSIKSFFYRVFGDVHYQTGRGNKHFDLDVALFELPPGVLQPLVLVLSFGVVALVLWRCRVRLRAWRMPGAALEGGLFLAALLLLSPEARAPHFLYAMMLGIAVTTALVRACRRHTVQHPSWLKASLALALLFAVLQNTDSSSLLGRPGAAWCSAFCTLGWGTLALMGAGAILLPRDESDTAT